MVIFSFALLGLVALQARATQVSYDAEDRTRASLMADEAVTLMWEYSTVSLPTTQADAYTAWQKRVSTPTVSGLPNGAGTVTTDANSVTWITITWQPPSRTTSSQYLTQIQMPPSQ